MVRFYLCLTTKFIIWARYQLITSSKVKTVIKRFVNQKDTYRSLSRISPTIHDGDSQHFTGMLTRLGKLTHVFLSAWLTMFPSTCHKLLCRPYLKIIGTRATLRNICLIHATLWPLVYLLVICSLESKSHSTISRTEVTFLFVKRLIQS